MPATLTVLAMDWAAAKPKAPKSGEGVKAGPIALAVILVLCVAAYFLFKSMSKQLRKVREEFPVGGGVDPKTARRSPGPARRSPQPTTGSQPAQPTGEAPADTAPAGDPPPGAPSGDAPGPA